MARTDGDRTTGGNKTGEKKTGDRTTSDGTAGRATRALPVAATASTPSPAPVTVADGLPPLAEIAAAHLTEERRLMAGLVERAVYTADERDRAGDLARRLVAEARSGGARLSGVDAFMRQYGLSSEEGVLLLCLAESLLRIPDADTADALIAEKIADGHWDRHLGASPSLWVNASTWGLLVTGKVVKLREAKGGDPVSALKRLVARSGEPVIRQAVRQAVKLLGDQFVMATTIDEALVKARAYEAKGYRLSYDMLGEAARTARDAGRYYDLYAHAITAIGRAAGPLASSHPDALMARPSVSVKLSALHPRFEAGKEARLVAELLPRLVDLCRLAIAAQVPLTIDAEEQDRLHPTLALFARLGADPALDRWSGLGLAVQAYGRRAIPVLRWLRRLAEAQRRRIPVRLVKGAYWDSEIKMAQEAALADYPVLTVKRHTDVSFLAAVRLLLSEGQWLYPQLATHNAHAMATAIVAAGRTPFELQRLYGMGEALYDGIVGDGRVLGSGAGPVAARIYAPVGPRTDLVAYLVRRLLENGANSSFLHRLSDDGIPLAELTDDPVAIVEQGLAASPAAPTSGPAAVATLPRPTDIYGGRRGCLGLPLSEPSVRADLLAEMAAHLTAATYAAAPIVDGARRTPTAEPQLLRCPHDRRERIGTVAAATAADIEAALASATAAADGFDRTPVEARAAMLERAADLMERDRARLMAVIVREAGKTLANAQGDVIEAVDLLRYYAGEARRVFPGPVRLPGPTGEVNVTEWRARGPVACISPWNFPLAIFTGQIAAALAAGNPVLAKPAPQTPITAMLATGLLHEAGVPVDALHLLPGDGRVGAALVRDPRVRAVMLTGSTATAQSIARVLADRRGGLVPFIAETGGVNCLIADSSALPEQVVRDCVRGAFDSAGQRCSATRVLFVHEDIAGRVIDMLVGAVDALDLGDPMDLATDVGPVIDPAAQDRLDSVKMHLQATGRRLVDLPLPAACRAGTYVTPAAYEIDALAPDQVEIFGPVLQVVRYGRGALDQVVDAIDAMGHGLTLGLHSRLQAVADRVAERARVGNLYVNRTQIGARVGAQPFGGEGLSGTGPKAGGPNLLTRLATERVRSTDVTATGGNWQLMSDG